MIHRGASKRRLSDYFSRSVLFKYIGGQVCSSDYGAFIRREFLQRFVQRVNTGLLRCFQCAFPKGRI